MAVVVLAQTYKFGASDDYFAFGWEMGRIARAVATGHGYGDPFRGHTGPSAWVAPLYTYLVVAAFKLFGVYSSAAGFAVLTMNSAFSALTCIPVYRLARRCFGEKVAVGSGWTYALVPYVIYWATFIVWETTLSALLFTWLMVLTLELPEKDGWRPWLQFGLLWGLTGLSSPVLLLVLPASGLWVWYHRARVGKRSLGGVAVSALIFVACMAPWVLRNYVTFHKFWVRSNFGAELRLGNGPNADGTIMEYLHPVVSDYAYHQYAAMGELAYVEERKQEAVAWIKANPGFFLELCGRRIVYFWTGAPRRSVFPGDVALKNLAYFSSSIGALWGLGRAIRKRKPGAWMMFLAFLFYPLIYYVVFTTSRFRCQLDPMIIILCVYLVNEAEPGPAFWWTRKRQA